MTMQALTDAELDAVAAGASSARLAIASLLALGPTNASVTAEGVDVFTETVGGLAPSNTAFVGGTFTAESD